MVKLYDNNYYICKTCDKALQNNSVPCQAVANRLNVVDLPKFFNDIRRLERLLVSGTILFKNVTVIPKGKFRKLMSNVTLLPRQ